MIFGLAPRAVQFGGQVQGTQSEVGCGYRAEDG
jgi:hypothetical protein